MPGGGARGQYLEYLCTMLRCCVSFSSTVKHRTVKPYIRLLRVRLGTVNYPVPGHFFFEVVSR